MPADSEKIVRIITDEPDVVAATLAELGHPARQPVPIEDRRSIESLGPLVEYVLPALVSIALASRITANLARRFRTGVVIDTDEDGEIVIRRADELPRGMVVVRKDGESIDVLDVTDDGALESLIDLLKRPG